MTNRILFSVLAILSLGMSYLINKLIITDDVYFAYFQNQLSFKRIEMFLEIKRQFQWVGYFLIPVFIFIKIAVVSICLLLGTFIANVKTQFSSLFSVVTKAEFVLVIPSIIILLWFGFIQTDYSLEDTQNFAPLSLLNFFDPNLLEAWEKYPLSILNIFQVLYILILSYSLSKKMILDFDDSLKMVLLSYGSFLLIWTAFVTFLIVSFS